MRAAESMPETAFYWAALVIAGVGLTLLFLQRGGRLAAGYDRTIEDFRSALAGEYARQAKRARLIFGLTLALFFSMLFATQLIRAYRHQAVTPVVILFPVAAIISVVMLLAIYRRFDERSVRRILRGY
jgi:hypothetical protein